MSLEFKSFERRLRIARAWRFGWIGLAAGSVAAAVMAVLDETRVIVTTYPQLGVVIGTGALLGTIYGISRRTSARDLARSIDVRAKLEDRLSSSMGEVDSAFAGDLQGDAESRLGQVKPKSVFPIKLYRWQYAQIPVVILPFALMYLNLSHLFLTSDARKEREELKPKAVEVQRALDPIMEHKESLTPDEKVLARELQRLKLDLERMNLNKEEAQEKANKIAEDAQKLIKEDQENQEKAVNSAQDALDQLQKDAAQKELPDMPQDMKDLKGQALRDKLQELVDKHPNAEKEAADLQKEIDALKSQLEKTGLTERQKQSLQKQLKNAQAKMAELKLSEAAKKFLQKIQNDPLFAKLQAMMAKMQKSQSGQGTPPTKEQMEEFRKALEKMAKTMTDKDIHDMLQRMIDALKSGKMGMCKKAGFLGQMGPGLSGPGGLMPGAYAATQDFNPSGAPLNFNKDEKQGLGKTNGATVHGDQRDDTPDDSPYVMQRGMAKLTGPSSIPMLKLVPASKRKAEEAISKQQIPKDQQERVRKYFESLEGKNGGK